MQINQATYDSSGKILPVTGADAGAYWTAGAGATDPATGAFDALGRLGTEKWDGGAVTKSRSYLPGSNLPKGFSTTMTNSGANVYSVQAMTWQGTLLASYTVASDWEGGGTAYAADYDADAHLQKWSATSVGSPGSASQAFDEGYAFSLENLATVNTTNSLGAEILATCNYADLASAERVTSISTPNSPVTDSYAYDRRGRGLVVQHKLNAAQNPAQDSYEYDSQNRLVSIAYLGSTSQTLAYDGVGDLVSRQFPAGNDIARYYIGDDLTLVNHNSTSKTGLVHIRLGGKRLASFWSKSESGTNTSGVIYYHRDRRGDVVATTAGGGKMGLSYRYLPSGAIDKIIDAAGNKVDQGKEGDDVASGLGFIGGLKLSGGLIHLKARAYSPALRRFLQADTIDFRRYTYAAGDPINIVDPSGRIGTKDSSKDTTDEEHNGNWGATISYLHAEGDFDAGQAYANGELSPDQVTVHTQHWGNGQSRSWFEVDPASNASITAINDWLDSVVINDSIARAAYRIRVAGANSGSRKAFRSGTRTIVSFLGKAFSEAVQSPMGNDNPTKTNPGVDALAETTGELGAIGLTVGLGMAINNVATAGDSYAALATESGTYGGALSGGEIGAGLAMFAISGVITGGASVAIVIAAGVVGSIVGGDIGGQGASTLYGLMAK